MRKFALVSFVVLLLVGVRGALADSPANSSLFDPAKYMRVSEVRPGMKGYGLSVFSGTKIEQFDVEVVDVVKNFNPKYDAILVRCPGDFLKETGPIAGMSGSPIYLY
ncbi:MAG TPA: SpoIVB peptidase S55 domain-containing protein, partial [Tepidisphaeraceae bacterium]